MITFTTFGNYGRLGNQMFQYALLKSVSLTKVYNIALPIHKNNKLGLNFNLKCHFYDINSTPSTNSVFKEKQFNYDPSVFDVQHGTDFIGYFQSEKYFSRIKHIIRREFTLRNFNITNKAKETINEVRKIHPNKKIVAFHVRRGDNVPSETNYSDHDIGVYLSNKEDYHPLLTKEYIEEAPNLFDNSVYLIFSDTQKDIEWCKQNIKLDNVYFVGGESDLFDFECMRYCDHNIISNSSFSWWAAWLNENPEKVVVAPSKWFGKAYKDYDTSDLLPKEWKII